MKNNQSFLVSLWKASRKRFASDEDYFRFQQLQAVHVIRDVARLLSPPQDSFVIDFGCGRGGYSECLAEHFAEVLAVDFRLSPHHYKRKATYLSQDLTTFEPDRQADLIFCASVIEHMANQEATIRRLHRILKPGGALYLSYPPFWSIGGGHQLKPFHYLPEQAAIALGKRLGRIRSSATGYENLFGTWGLYRTSIRSIRLLLETAGFECLVCKPRYFRERGLFNTTTWPLIADLCTWHVEFYCRKPG
jgi:ubiquinone/menaquinone biosynthesis C-methylase UbiE